MNQIFAKNSQISTILYLPYSAKFSRTINLQILLFIDQYPKMNGQLVMWLNYSCDLQTLFSANQKFNKSTKFIATKLFCMVYEKK